MANPENFAAPEELEHQRQLTQVMIEIEQGFGYSSKAVQHMVAEAQQTNKAQEIE